MNSIKVSGELQRISAVKRPTVAVVGLESVGKSSLLSAIVYLGGFCGGGSGVARAFYLSVLAITTLVYLRFITLSLLRQVQNKILLPSMGYLHPPQLSAVFREIVQSLRDFIAMALPIFIGICMVAGVLSGALALYVHLFAPAMGALCSLYCLVGCTLYFFHKLIYYLICKLLNENSP